VGFEHPTTRAIVSAENREIWSRKIGVGKVFFIGKALILKGLLVNAEKNKKRCCISSGIA
jgi:hypothetical protein